jgi:HNH endonuclease
MTRKNTNQREASTDNPGDTGMQCIAVKWLVGEARGYTDRFAVEDFARLTRGADRVHLVLGPHGGRHHARCRVTVREKRARLDYRPFKSFNARHGMKPGLLELSFTDETRSHVSRASWDGEPLTSDDAEIVTLECDNVTGNLQEERERKYGLIERPLRPGQPALYAELERTYGGCCSISECPVPFALVVAHLVSVANSGSDSPTNAILLRSDLHALLDTNQLGIHPRTRRVYVSKEARAWRDYAKLHGSVTLAAPQPGFAANKPNADFLVERWNVFIGEHGDPTAGS